MTFEIVTTRNCNLQCKYCFEGKKQSILMPTSMIPMLLHFIEDFRKKEFISDNSSVHIDFNGGETLLNLMFIKQFLKTAENFKFNYSFTTNGILINDEIINLINKYDIFLQISLDGNQKTHDYNRVYYDGTGSFDDVLKKLKLLQSKCKKDMFQIATVVTPETVQSFAENFDFFIANGFTKITVVGCSDYLWTDNNYDEFEKQLHIIGDNYIKSFENNIFIDFSLFNKNIDNSLDGLIKRKCDAINGEIAILPDGNILPCGGFVGCQNEKNFYIGNIFTSIDENKIKLFLSQSLKIKNESCKECNLFNRCQNDCFALNNRINKNILIPDESSCRINQIAIKESDRILAHFMTTKNKCFFEHNKNILERLEKKNQNERK